MSFEQATIKVEKEKEFAELRDAVQRIFSSEKGKFLQLLQSKNVRIRNLDAVLAKGLIERADEALAKVAAHQLKQQRPAHKQVFEEVPSGELRHRSASVGTT